MAQTIQPENRGRHGGTILVVSAAVASSAKAIFVKLAYSIRGFAGPVSTILLASIFLGEPLTAAKIVGTGLVLAGMLQLRAADAG